MSTGNSISDVLQMQRVGVTRAAETNSAQVKTGESAAKIDTSIAAQDEAKLSAGGGLLAAALNTSDVRTAKVDALREAIASGTYNVPSSIVADKVLDSMIKR